MNHFREIVRHIMDAVVDSGLNAILSGIYYCVSGSADDVVRPLLPSGVPLHLWACQVNRRQYERLTLHRLAEMAQQALTDGGEFFVLYVHSKGVSKPPVHHAKIHEWREMMLHFVVKCWPLCLKALSRDPRAHGAVGSNVQAWPARHYSGNFWWATSEYLRTLPLPIGGAYLDPEMWIGRGDAQLLSLYQHPHWRHMRTAFRCPPYQSLISNKFLSIMNTPIVNTPIVNKEKDLGVGPNDGSVRALDGGGDGQNGPGIEAFTDHGVGNRPVPALAPARAP